MKILILASNPRKDIDLDEEIRLLRNAVDQSRARDQFEIVSEPGVRVGDLQRLLLRHKPQIVHFSGHGSGKEGLIFKMDGGGEQWVRADALAGMFELNPIRSHVKCVLLNACYSEEQADAIVSSIDYVVGMSHEIQDDAAIAFSKGFYLALGEGCSFDDSFEFGKNAIQLEISGSSKKMRSVSEAQRKLEVTNAVTNISIPEHLKPILKKKVSINIPTTNPALSQETRAKIQLSISKTLEEDSKTSEEDITFKQYREEVRRYLSDRKLDDYEKDILDELRDEIGLSPEKASQILEEELAPILQAKQAYKTRLNTLIKYYPFRDEIGRELKKFQSKKNLTDEEVEQISKPILEAAEVEYQAKLRQRYEQEIKQVIDASSSYPIDEVARQGLKNLQQSLGLSDENVARIEQPIIEQEKAKYENNLWQYKQEFSNTVRVDYPLNQSVQEQLKNLQQSWGLKGKDITLIEQPILEQAEATYQEKLREQDADDLRSEKGVDYTQLRDLLKAGQWKEADQETLNVMLKAAGCVSEGPLSASIENFPCTDLRTIDQLWVKYSKGRFGFSVQKKIWQEVNRDYEAFGDRVGWLEEVWIEEKDGNGGVGKEFIDYNKLTFSLEAPKGNLPVAWLALRVGMCFLSYRGREITSLVSRLVNCNLQ